MSDELNQVKSQIPHREPFLFVDRIVEQTATRIVTERLIRADEPHFAGHYPGSPLMPGVLICEACFQTGAILLAHRSAGFSSDVGVPPAPVMWASRPQSDAPLNIHWRGRLPHWETEGGIYFVTWRLADSLPDELRRQLAAQREHLIKVASDASRELSPSEKRQLEALHTEKMETLLNAGHGECHMNDRRCARIVADALAHFNGERYDLHAWCLMPNHVHVVFQVRPGHELADVMHSWKSFTAKACNKLLGRSGAFWMDESFDRLVRDEEEYGRFVRYTLENPVAAGLKDWEWVGMGKGFAGGSPTSLTAAGGTPTSRPVLTRILEAKFRGMVRPGDLMRVDVDLEEKMGDAFVMNGRVDVAGKNVLRVKFIVAMVDVQG